MSRRLTTDDVTKVPSAGTTATYRVNGPKRSYWVDVLAGKWFCSCGHPDSCTHVRLAKEVHSQ